MVSKSRVLVRGSAVRCGWMVIACAALVCGSCWATADDRTMDAKPRKHAAEESAIRNLIAQYAQSVDAADTALASRIWSHSPEVSFIHPLGEEHGFEQIAQDVYTHLMGDTFSQRQLQIHDISVHLEGKAAWAEFHWDFQAKFKKDGTPLTTQGRETQIYHKEKDGWRLVHVHYSAMPAAAPSSGPS